MSLFIGHCLDAVKLLSQLAEEEHCGPSIRYRFRDSDFSRNRKKAVRREFL
jgi:hypothetical protein